MVDVLNEITVELDVHDGADLHDFWLCRFSIGEVGAWGVHRHEQHQLAWVSQGTATVVAAGGPWIATSARAIWIPSNHPHDIHVGANSELICLYVWPQRCPLGWIDPTELTVGPLVRELLLELSSDAPGVPVSSACATVLFEQLGRHDPPTRPTLPMPTDDRAADVARAILADPASPRTLEDWAKAVAASPSTLQRAFVTETSLTFGEWRARARLDAALPLLANGVSAEQAAARVGYSSRSGFVDAYRRHFGHSFGP